MQNSAIKVLSNRFFNLEPAIYSIQVTLLMIYILPDFILIRVMQAGLLLALLSRGIEPRANVPMRGGHYSVRASLLLLSKFKRRY